MSRRLKRFAAFARARWKRLSTTVARAVLTDTDVTTDTAAADHAEAQALADAAMAMRAGVAKIAQLRAYLDPTAPDAARTLLSRLWDHMPADAPEAVRRVVTEDLGPLERHFAEWDDQPLAAASLGQVHAARAHDGTRLAVKVQYPGVAEALAADLASKDVLKRLVGAGLGEAVAREALDVLEAQIRDELDYEKERESLERFRLVCASDPSIVIPRGHRALSSKRVLTMDRLDGRPLAAVMDDAPAARTRTAEVLFRFAFGTPLRHGIANADPNPGNYLVLDEGRVGFVDFGCVVAHSEEVQAQDRRLWLSMIHRDGETLRHAAHEQGLIARAEILDSTTWREWEEALAAPFLARDYALEPAHAQRLIELTSKLVRARAIELPAPVLLLWRQRLGALAVISRLRPRLPFRALLAELLDDRKHPIPLAERYR